MSFKIDQGRQWAARDREERRDFKEAIYRNQIQPSFTGEANWQYALRDGRTQTFPCNLDTLNQRRWNRENTPSFFKTSVEVP
jgi:hypothetical protein